MNISLKVLCIREKALALSGLHTIHVSEMWSILTPFYLSHTHMERSKPNDVLNCACNIAKIFAINVVNLSSAINVKCRLVQRLFILRSYVQRTLHHLCKLWTLFAMLATVSVHSAFILSPCFFFIFGKIKVHKVKSKDKHKSWLFSRLLLCDLK